MKKIWIPFSICFFGGIATALLGVAGLVAAVVVAFVAPIAVVAIARRSST
jgi:hypothetical protein